MHKAFASKAKGKRKLLECLKNYFWSYEKILYHASNRGTATARWELNYDRQSNTRNKSIRRPALWWRTIRLRWWLIRAAKCIINYHTHSTINHLCVWQGWLLVSIGHWNVLVYITSACCWAQLDLFIWCLISSTDSMIALRNSCTFIRRLLESLCTRKMRVKINFHSFFLHICIVCCTFVQIFNSKPSNIWKFYKKWQLEDCCNWKR